MTKAKELLEKAGAERERRTEARVRLLEKAYAKLGARLERAYLAASKANRSGRP
jgi:hypothetical protein